MVKHDATLPNPTTVSVQALCSCFWWQRYRRECCCNSR